MEEILVTGGRQAIQTLSGSATFIGEELIGKFEATDLNAVLSSAPGIYIRQEDGFGLRPNIGLRGTTSERSTKITIMEDGVLIGPAPYSAPAAYYIPNISRMEALEVFKGPSAIQHGPHTVGGAINLVTRRIPQDREGEFSLTRGSFGYEKTRVFYADNHERFGYWIDALRYGSDGFKELDGGGDTGFIRNDVNAKFQWRSDQGESIYQEFELKLGYADEEADETYLGLTDEDFNKNPMRRYSASQLDRFVSEHQQIHLLHTADFRNDWKLSSRVYYNTFERSWNKLDGIVIDRDGGMDAILWDVLVDPHLYPQDVLLLRGDVDTNPNGNQRLDVTNNDRSFTSSGIEFRLKHDLSSGAWKHKFEGGIRFHSDSVERDHSPRAYQMINGQLVYDETFQLPIKKLNEGETDALAFYLQDKILFESWTLNLGLRYETITSSFIEKAGKGANIEGTQNVLMPGFGVFYSMNEKLGLLFGVNKGFSAKAASAREEVDPEESTNFEYGFRYQSESTKLEIIGFYSDYINILGRCRTADACAGEEFNGGEATVAGLELNSEYNFILSNGLEVPISFVYTYTDAQFETNFDSSLPQWGSVEKGDEMPYLPKNQFRLQVGFEKGGWSSAIAAKHVGEMRETAGKGKNEFDEFTESLTVFDLSISYEVSDSLKLRLVGENISDEQEIVSRRSFGARPNQPRTIKANITYHF